MDRRSGGERRAAARRPSAWDRALRLLAVRDRSRREVEVRLLRAGYEPAEISATLDRLEAAGLLDDDRFAAIVTAHERGSRGSSARAVRSALLRRGVGADTVERALAALPDDEEERAGEAARRRGARLSGVDAATAHRRLVSYLLRRGYAPDVARRAAAEALGHSEKGFYHGRDALGRRPHPPR
jgi:regulatory protein